MSKEIRRDRQRQSQFTDELLYYFLRVRKDRVRKLAKRLADQHPDETPKQLAFRIIGAKTRLSFIGGTLTHLPMLLPGIGQAFKFLGFVGATSMMTRMHLSLILEIAVLYGKDIDDKARLPEIAAVVAAVGLAAAAPFLVRVFELNPLYGLPAAAISASTVTRIVGESAIRLYEEEGESLPEALHA